MGKEKREYRSMPILIRNDGNKRLDTDYYVEGFATTFDRPYELFEDYDGVKFYEAIDRHALDNADMSDVLFQFNHSGRVYARSKMKKGVGTTLIVEPQDSGLFIAANLGLTTESRKMFEDIDAGLIYQMSWAFVVEESSYNRDTHTRTITKVKKVYDVSAVDLPANANTEISARSAFEGFIEAEKRELAERNKQIQRIKILTEAIKHEI